MAWPSPTAAAVAMALAAWAALPSAAQADPPPWAGSYHHDDDRDYRVVYVPATPMVYPYYVIASPIPVIAPPPDDRVIAPPRSDDENYGVRPARSDGENEPYCREYQSTSVISGHSQRVWGTACRRPDGQWEIVD